MATDTSLMQVLQLTMLAWRCFKRERSAPLEVCSGPQDADARGMSHLTMWGERSEFVLRQLGDKCQFKHMRTCPLPHPCSAILVYVAGASYGLQEGQKFSDLTGIDVKKSFC
eukprot:4675880-Amphidinium_carterae.2